MAKFYNEETSVLASPEVLLTALSAPDITEKTWTLIKADVINAIREAKTRAERADIVVAYAEVIDKRNSNSIGFFSPAKPETYARKIVNEIVPQADQLAAQERIQTLPALAT